MKKIIAIVCALLSVAVTAFGAVDEAGVSTENNVYVSGKLNDGVSRDCVTLCIKDADGKALYVNEVETKADGSYEAKFKYKGGAGENLNLYVQDGSEDLAASVEIANVESVSKIESVLIKSEHETDIPAIGDFAKAVAKVKNKYADSGRADVILAYYDENNAFVGMKKTTADFDYALESEISSDLLEIGEKARKIKAFVWNSVELMVPMVEAKTQDIANIIDVVNPTKVVVAGDSLVHIDGLVQNLEMLYNTRYPENQITFINKGVGGDTSDGLLSRFDWDVLNDPITGKPDVVIIASMGYNESFWVYDGGRYDTDYFHSEVKKNYENSMKSIVDKCKENNIDVVLVSQSFYDDNENNSALTGKLYKNLTEGQAVFDDSARKIASEKGVPFIDDHTPFLNYQKEFLANNRTYSGEMFTINDRVHQSPAGKMIKAALLAKGMGMGETVSSVEIDENNSVTAVGAEVSDITRNNNGVSYTYKPSSLPVYVSDAYKKAEYFGVNLTDMINREIIKVKGLEDGAYSVAIDGTEIGEFTDDELLTGVNIAACENNPGQKTAEQVSKLLSKASHGAYRNTTAISYVLTKESLGFNVNVNDVNEIKKFIEEHPDGINYSGTYTYSAEDLEKYLAEKETEPQRYTELLAKQTEAKQAAVCGEYTVTITKK